MNMKEIKIYSVEVFNLNTTAMYCGKPVPKGCLGIKISRRPEFIYQRIGNHFVAHDSGIVHHYTYSPGTKEGFAGREITIPVSGVGKVFRDKGVTRMTFKGSLWNSADGAKAAKDLLGEEIYSIGIAAPRDRGYASAMITKSFLDRLSRVVVIGQAEQSPLI